MDLLEEMGSFVCTVEGRMVSGGGFKSHFVIFFLPSKVQMDSLAKKNAWFP